MTTNVKTKREAALELAAAGFPIHPIKAGEKRPASKNGFHDATTDLERVEKFWNRVPDANIGLATGKPSGIFVLDIDAERGGFDTLSEIEEVYGTLPETLSQDTPSGGTHYFFKHRDGLGCTNDKIGAGIDTRGDGGYVLVAPSELANGKRYELIDPFDIEALAECPDFLISLMSGTKSNGQGVLIPQTNDKKLAEPIATEIPKGRRDSELTSIAGTMRRRGMTDKEMLPSLTAINKERCKPPKDLASVERIAKSVARYEPGPSKNGGVKPRKQILTKDLFAGYEKLGLSFRRNVLDDRIEVNEVSMTDDRHAVIDNAMRDLGFNSSLRIENAFRELASQNIYHPVKDKLESLSYNRKTNIAAFAAHCETDSDSWTLTCWTSFLVAAVAKTFEQAQNRMLVLVGGQGIGKSRMVRWLTPGGLEDYFIEDPIRPDEKDSLIRQTNNILWEVSELQSTTRKADRESLKDFISKQKVTTRRPYAKYDTVKPALANFIGTVNESGTGILHDPTGSRRFLILKLNGINWNYEKALNSDDIWAEAVHLYKSGEPWELTPEEISEQKDVNADYEITTPVEEYFGKYYKIDPNLDKWIAAVDVISYLESMGLKINQRFALMQLAELMVKKGVEKKRPRIDGRQTTAYKGLIQRG